MLDLLNEALATPGLIWLVLTISVAGIVRGFTGFGTALIFIPIANIFLDAPSVIILVSLTGVASTSALLPKAWHVAEKKEVSILAGAALLTVPLGIWVLLIVDQTVVRWIVSGAAISMLLALILGWRYRGTLNFPKKLGLGASAGTLGGMTGLTGPIVILFYLARGVKSDVVRANTILFLGILDIIVLANMFARGQISWNTVAIAFVLSIPYFMTARIGQSMFKPEYEQTYRYAAYAVIAVAALTGLPLWDKGL